jgi:hypothetical protein
MHYAGNTKTEVHIGKDSFLWLVGLGLDDRVVDLLELTLFGRRGWKLVNTSVVIHAISGLTFC